MNKQSQVYMFFIRITFHPENYLKILILNLKMKIINPIYELY